MVSRKKAAGKARKAKKAAKAEAKEERNDPTTIIQQLNRLQCKHGAELLSSSNDVCFQFALAFRKSFSVCKDTLLDCLFDARKALLHEFADVWNDTSKLEIAIAFFLCTGTQDVLECNYANARDSATIARFLDEHIATQLKQTQAIPNMPKTEETYYADLHTLVKFFRHRIPCSCLDEKYEEVKHITKLGTCYYSECSIPNRMPERSKTKYCSRCRTVTYCSRECQVADWTNHKNRCDRAVEFKAKFEAKVKARQREAEAERLRT